MRSAYRKLAFSLANTTAVLVALFIAFSQNFERPYWAMFTVFILAKPISGVVRSKGAFRFMGTFAGAAMTLFLIPPLVQSPWLLCLAISGWAGICLYVSLLDRTPRSYAFMLAGYSVAIIGFSVVNTPESVFDTCVSRLEEISVGILCGTLAHSLFFPQNVAKELWERVDRTVSAASAHISMALAGSPDAKDREATERLAAAVSGIQILYTHIAFETSNVPRATGIMRALLDRLALLPPYLTSVEDARDALLTQAPIRWEVSAMLQGASRWAHNLSIDNKGPAARPAEYIIDDVKDAPHWGRLLELSVVDNLNHLVATLYSARNLANALLGRHVGPTAELRSAISSRSSRRLSLDHGLALLSGAAATGSILLACAIWIYTSWPEGIAAAEFAAIGSCLFATLDKPTKLIGAAITGILIALPASAVYEFAIIPRIDGFASLALVLSPMIFLFSFMLTYEKLEGAALVLAMAFSGGLALQSSYKADFAAFLNSSSAEIAGLLIAATTITVFRTIDPVWNAWRLSRKGWRSIINLAHSDNPDMPGWFAQMLDRISLISLRLRNEQTNESKASRIDPLRDLQVGLAIRDLKVAHGASMEDAREVLAHVFDATSQFYRDLLKSGTSASAIGAPTEIDTGLHLFYPRSNSAIARSALTALTRLRLRLYPRAEPYRHVAAAP